MGKRFAVSTGETILGRAADADLRLEDDGVSRHHARLTCTPEGRVYVEDLGSTNGTLVNDERVASRELADGDKIYLGRTTVLKFNFHDSVEEEFQRRLLALATRDGLTGAYNRASFEDRFAPAFARARRKDLPLALVVFDLDFFKRVNDRYGHAAGDYVLRETATVAASDVRAEDLLCRYGGEEFALLLADTSAARAVGTAERIRAALASTAFEFGGRRIPVTASFGVATTAEGFETAAAFFAAADARLYEAKEGGRNKVVG